MLRPNSLRHQLGWILLLVCITLRPCYAQAQQTVAQLAGKIDSELATILSTSSSTKKQQLSASLVQHVTGLKEQSIMVFGGRREQLEEKLQHLIQSCENWQSGSSDEARAAAERAQPQLTESPIIGAEILADGPLEVGKRADLRIRLFFFDNSQPVALSDLEETHTRKIHLLISDITETDYHHEHPEPAGDGEYAFSFTPQRPDTYRVWADLRPVRTHVQQYSVANIPSSAWRQAKLPENEAENRRAEIDGYKFELSFEKDVIHERETVAGKLRVTEPDGQPCKKLGVVMGAFGHFVGFGDEFVTLLHLHPTGPPITDPEARSGPELPFYFRSNKTGLFRLFAQVKIEGKDFFPRFVLRVQPLQRLPSL